MKNKIISSFVLLVYVSLLFPFSLISQEINDNRNNVYFPDGIFCSEKVISPETGGEVELGKAKIEIPAGALKKKTKISITYLNKVNKTEENIRNAIPDAGGFRFLPKGTKFLKEVFIYLPYDPSLSGEELENLFSYFYDTKKKKWVRLERIALDRENFLVKSVTTHFTDMITATLALPELANPIDVNINSIKKLKSARPDSHLINFNAPSANSFGNAQFSFDLKIPAGRQNIQPLLQLMYAGKGNNGMLGNGFSLNCCSVISTETRFGLPLYNTKDTYSIDGILMEEKYRNGNIAFYSLLKEEAFKQIVRNLENNTWVITDKNGVKSFYGVDENSSAGSGSKKFKWYISKIEDVNGNNVIYEYEKDSGYVYPSKIFYTGNGNVKGNYCISFEYNKNRKDIRSDGRSGELVECRWLLKSIKVSYGEESWNCAYNFIYDENVTFALENYLTELKVENKAGESYSYSFDYEKIDSKSNVFSYFDEEKVFYAPVQSENSRTTGSSNSFVDAIGYGTALLDIRTSMGTSSGSSITTLLKEDSLIDLDGDGILDSVEFSGNVMNVTILFGKNSGKKYSVNCGVVNQELISTSSSGKSKYKGAGVKSWIIDSAGTSSESVTQKSSGRVQRIFCDVDGDGLTDILETGSSEYLRNCGIVLGQLKFERTKLFSDSENSISDIRKTYTADEIAGFKNIYKKQVPFRVWTAPFTASFSVKNTITPSKDFSGNNVRASVYVGDSEIKDKKLTLAVEKGKISFSEAVVQLEKGEKLYFFPETGDLPASSDFIWDIQICVNKLKVLSAEDKPEVILEIDTEGNKLKKVVPLCFSVELFMKMLEELNVQIENAERLTEEDNAFLKMFSYDSASRQFKLKNTEKQQLESFWNNYYSKFSDSLLAEIENQNAASFERKTETRKMSFGKNYEEGQPGQFIQDNKFLLDVINGNEIIIDEKNLKANLAGEYEYDYILDDGKAVINYVFSNFIESIEKFQNVEKTISYNFDADYLIDEEGCYDFYRFENEDSAEIICETRTLADNLFSSFLDVGLQKKEEEFKQKISDSGIDVTEYLFGGHKGWAYGVWLGEENFSGTKLESIVCMLKTELSEKKIAEMGVAPTEESETDEKESLITENKFYSLGVFSSEQEFEKEGESKFLKEELVDALVGRVSTDSNFDGDELVVNYYLPFICGNYIHSNRIGGKVYELLGLENQTDSTNKKFSVSNVRYSETTGYDDVSLTDVSINLFNTEEEFSTYVRDLSFILQQEAESRNSAFEDLGLGKSKGTNKSFNVIKQNFADVTGDGIVDFIQVDGGNRITVYPGAKKWNEESGQIYFQNGYVLKTSNNDNLLGSISRTENNVSVTGASLSSKGGTKTVYSSNGKILSIESNVSESGGGEALSYGKGSGNQTQGFIDINGDGLLDYVKGNTVYYSQGKSFVQGSVKLPYSNLNTSKSENVSISVPFNTVPVLGQSLTNGVKAGGGVNYSFSYSDTTGMYLDFNGDGLEDYVVKNPESNNFYVSFNTGKEFLSPKQFSISDWNLSAADINKLFRQSDTGFSLGFVGKLERIGGFAERLISKAGFYDAYGANIKKYGNALDFTSSVGINIGGTVVTTGTISLGLGIGNVNNTMSSNYDIEGSTSVSGVSVKMLDVDGDGFIDRVLRIPGEQGKTIWKRNTMGKLGLLKTIHIPQGGEYQLSYTENAGTPDSPVHSFLLTKVVVEDGCNNRKKALNHGTIHKQEMNYEYFNAFYDRDKKEFFGFEKVVSYYPDQTKTVCVFENKNYYSYGTLLEKSSYSKNGVLLENKKIELCDSPYNLVKLVEKNIYEENSKNEGLKTVEKFDYDLYGNIIRYTKDCGSAGVLTTETDYYENQIKYIVAKPVEFRVLDSQNQLLKKRSAVLDSKGQIEELKQFYRDSEALSTYYSYDSYGNINSAVDENGSTVKYVYDSADNQFVEKIIKYGNKTDSYEYLIKTDPATQCVIKETDCNNNSVEYKYDSWDRLLKVYTDYDKNAQIPSVEYEYHNGDRWYVVCNNKVSFNPEDKTIIQTVTEVDGIGRKIFVAKTGYVQGREGWNVSENVEYDSKGRIVKKGLVQFVEGNLKQLLESELLFTSLVESYTYDDKNRIVVTELPDKTKETIDYCIDENRLKKTITDANGNYSVQTIDENGNVLSIGRYSHNNDLLNLTQYEYDQLNRLVHSIDFNLNKTQIEYDLLGRTVSLESADSGRYEYFYDRCSNLIRESNSVLRKSGKQIKYEYDGLNRLVKVDYPESDDVFIEYGKKSDSVINAAGRKIKVKDASGEKSWKYGSLGEVIWEKKTLTVHKGGRSEQVSAVMEYDSDYLGRIQKIKYPDGEEVFYNYDKAGQVCGVYGKNFGQTFDYVKDVLYNQFGQRTYIEYGNGVSTEYTYDEERQWLDSVFTVNKWNQVFQNIKYTFDSVGNILSYSNDCNKKQNGNYYTSQDYTYDDLYQLVKVEGNSIYNPYNSSEYEFETSYIQEFAFDSIGNLILKDSSEKIIPIKTIGDNLNYEFRYSYSDGYAHRLNNAGNTFFKYDENGNIVLQSEGLVVQEEKLSKVVERPGDKVEGIAEGWGIFKNEKQNHHNNQLQNYKKEFCWNEKNQLVSVKDSNGQVYFVYDSNGNRCNKYTDSSETLYFNDMWLLNIDGISASSGGQTGKNIYLGNTRIVTKLNSKNNPSYDEEHYKMYFYHGDHLGSASLITDWEGMEYERIEYTPYGEIWINKTSVVETDYLPYKFTAKELDAETGLYYYGARYLDPKYSRWLSTDPAINEYMQGSQGGEGGVFNHKNLNLYHYAGNNPVKYTDPDGREVDSIESHYHMTNYDNTIPNSNGSTVKTAGCAVTLDANVCYSAGDSNTTPATIAQNESNFDSSGNLKWDKPLPEGVSAERVDEALTKEKFNEYKDSESHYFIGIQVQYTGTPEAPGNSSHWVGANSVYTDESGDDYYVISATSNYDNVLNSNPNGNNRGGLGWKNIDGVGTVVPVNRVTGYIVYKNEVNE